MSIGQRLKQARKSCNISQDVLAEKIGASRGVITNIEHDKIAKPQPMVINALCNVLGINKEWLLDGTGPMNISTKENQSPQVLSEIYEQAQKLSEEEQLFILDMIKSYTKHMKDNLFLSESHLLKKDTPNRLCIPPVWRILSDQSFVLLTAHLFSFPHSVFI